MADSWVHVAQQGIPPPPVLPEPSPPPSHAFLPRRGRVRGGAQDQTRTQQFGPCETFLKAELERDAATEKMPRSK